MICIYSRLTLVASVASPARMAYSEYVKHRIVFYHRSRKNCAEIAQCLAEEGYEASKVVKFLRRYKESGTIAYTGSSRTSKVNPEICKLIEEQMQKDDETTVLELKQLLKKEGFDASETSISQWRRNMGWTSKGTRYCQMIRDVNKEKRLNFAKENKDMTLQDTIYTDETTVQIEAHR